MLAHLDAEMLKALARVHSKECKGSILCLAFNKQALISLMKICEKVSKEMAQLLRTLVTLPED